MDKIEFFDKIYKTYDKYRPGYPIEMFADIFSYKPLNVGCRLLEIGIGTGKATQPFIDKGLQVASVEPGKRMAKFIQEKYKEYPDFSCYNFTFEKYMGFNNSFDLIYSGTAIHHMDEDFTYNKIFKLLKSGGVFARFAYHAGRDLSNPSLSDAIDELYKKYMPSDKEYKIFTETDAKEKSLIAEKYGFTDISYKLYSFTKDFSADEYLKLLSTYPDHMSMKEKTREEFFKEIGKTIKAAGNKITVNYIVDLSLARKP